MNCVVTKNETDRKYSNIPLSREGLQQVREYQSKVAQLKKDTGLNFTMTTKMAIDDLSKGNNIVDNYYKKMKEAEEKVESESNL